MLGSDHPIAVQSMASVSTMDTEASIAQASHIFDAGASLVRFTAQGVREANNLALIRQGLDQSGYHAPLVADIHFNPKAADAALEVVEKVRVNPGNYVDVKGKVDNWTDEAFDAMHKEVETRFGVFVERAKALGRTIRIGVNHGSLSERMLQRYGDTPEGMVRSCLEYLDVCVAHDFDRVVISMKSSNPLVMTQAVRLLDETLRREGYPSYPLHLGVTEAGEGEDGRVKSAVGIGALLADGIGDTIRVSLSEDPELEVPVAFALVDYIGQRSKSVQQQEDLPDWTTYRECLAKGGRKQTYCVKGCIGGQALPCVVAVEMGGEESCADYIYRDGALYAVDGEQVIDALLVDANEVDEQIVKQLKEAPETVLLLTANGLNPVAEWRAAYVRLIQMGVKNPIVLHREYQHVDEAHYRLYAAADAGTILLDGWATGLMMEANRVDPEVRYKTQLGILQAARLRMSKTEYISCPGCGRTLYDLQSTIARIKEATSHLKGLKIGIMGCIVNGPGEMADADYGYVGGSPGKIDLYKQQTCVQRGVPQDQAVDALITLIKQNNDWHDPA